MQQLRKKVYTVIREDDGKSPAGRVFDVAIITLILLTVVFLIADTFPMPPWYAALSRVFEVVSVTVFTVEYLLRLWTAPFAYPDKPPARAFAAYVFSFMAVADLLSILPFYLPFVFPFDLRVLRVLRLFRLFRVFKFTRYTYALYTIQTVFKRRASQLLSSSLTILALMVITSILLYNIEHEAQPEVFTNALSGMWWALSVVTGAWYGNIFPITLLGKAIGALSAMLAIGLVAVPTGIVSAGFIEVFNEEKEIESRGELQYYLDVADKMRDAREDLKKGNISEESFVSRVSKLLNE